ncbi:hypothetical protein K435DRAFT_797210 [Dendrothele bispora CBS 962.96]|uniref:Uncharacterized protein n=1 Tax=Dendrothele bispora (strain CBS 962.96) TaxID=1314807 RepID=A0A4S8M377_DENBC|nr:hypothetical protein K435DRAFT_797210 [Dendrothele bispora CBS 962.96]
MYIQRKAIFIKLYIYHKQKKKEDKPDEPGEVESSAANSATVGRQFVRRRKIVDLKIHKEQKLLRVEEKGKLPLIILPAAHSTSADFQLGSVPIQSRDGNYLFCQEVLSLQNVLVYSLQGLSPQDPLTGLNVADWTNNRHKKGHGKEVSLESPNGEEVPMMKEEVK